MISTHGVSTPPTPATDALLRAGRQVFQRYLLQRVVGRGGMGVVWLALDEKLDRQVALKFLPEVFLMDAAARDDLKRETRHSLDLTHPHIVRIHDFVEDEEMAAIAMEYVDGPTLSQLRVEQSCRHFEPSHLGVWTSALCAALDYAHGAGRCVHRDLKPGNLMVSGRGVLKVADFGIACRLHNTAARVSAISSTGGTLGYMSPQQLRGELAAPSDDIYSVGATLYELLTGTLPFFGGDLALQIREIVPDAVSERRLKFGLPGGPLPKAWEETIAACLAKQPRDRPSSAGEIAQRLGLGAAPLSEIAPDLRQALPPTECSAPTSIVRLPKWRQTLDRTHRYWTPIIHHRWPILTSIAMCAAVAPWLIRPAPLGAQRSSTPSAAAHHDRQPAAFENAPYTPPPESSAPVAVSSSAPNPDATGDRLALLTPPPASSRTTGETGASVDSPRLQIVSTPPGIPFKVLASAYESSIAGVLRSGETPATLDDLAPGSYRVIFTPNGAPSRAATVQIPASGTANYEQDFPHGVIKFRSQPDGAEVICDGRDLGPAPLDLPLLPGKHEVAARWNGHEARARTVDLADAAEPVVIFDFRTGGSTPRNRSHHSKKAEDDSLLNKVGRSLKTFFTGDTGKKK